MKYFYYSLAPLFVFLFSWSCEKANKPVEILSLTASDSTIDAGSSIDLICEATDSDGDDLVYSWDSYSGNIESSGNTAVWTAPQEPGIYFISCWVTDDFGTSDAATIAITVEPANSVSIKGQVTNAVNRNPIPDVTVTISGRTTTTDQNGDYEIIFVQEGEHPTFGEAYGFCTYEGNINIPENFGQQNFIYNFSMSPIPGEGETRLLLNWGQKPGDLDSHLLTPNIEGQNYHISYSNRGNASSAPYATLDTDDVNGYGPETITIKQSFPGTYVYYIYQYSSDSNLPSSDAVIQIYNSPDCNAITVKVPTGGNGRYWHVCNINGETGAINVINEILDSEPNR